MSEAIETNTVTTDSLPFCRPSRLEATRLRDMKPGCEKENFSISDQCAWLIETASHASSWNKEEASKALARAIYAKTTSMKTGAQDGNMCLSDTESRERNVEKLMFSCMRLGSAYIFCNMIKVLPLDSNGSHGDIRP